MAARKRPNTPTNTITFKIGELSYKILTGTTRDFLSVKSAQGGWNILDDSTTLAVINSLEAQVSRLKPTE